MPSFQSQTEATVPSPWTRSYSTGRYNLGFAATVTLRTWAGLKVARERETSPRASHFYLDPQVATL
jgi:hypothetical protein